MANLREIQRRRSSISSTMQITRTMEMISTARIQRALERAESASPYKDAIANMLANVAANSNENDDDVALLRPHARVRNVTYILIASDRGLAGGFNIIQQRYVERKMHELAEQGIGSQVITCGRKPTEYFTYRKIKPALSFVGISSEPNMDEADRIASYVIDQYLREKTDKVEIVYWHARNRVDQTPVIETLLPLTKETLMMPNQPREEEAVSQVAKIRHEDYLFEPSATEVLGYLMPAYVRTVIYHALLDSAAAEHGARRRAMQSATDNAKDVLSALSRTYNKTRQGAITTELNEIIGGASALEDM